MGAIFPEFPDGNNQSREKKEIEGIVKQQAVPLVKKVIQKGFEPVFQTDLSDTVIESLA